MRTKHLMMAAVLPAVFAACTNDELVDLNQNASVAGLEGRQLVEGVKLTFGSEESRLAYNGKDFTWEAGDQIGACLMDVKGDNFADPSEAWSTRFTLVDYIQTNYKFTRDADANWNTEAKLCEGNYFFCFPYDAHVGSREAYSFTLNNQVLNGTSDADLNAAYIKNNGFVGYAKIERGASEAEAVKVGMVPVFGRMGISLKNVGTDTYKVEKIVLHGDAIKSKATINPITCTEAIQGIENDFNIAQYVGDNSDPTWKENFNTYNKTAALVDVVDYGNVKDTDDEVVVTLNGGNVIKTQESVRVIAVVVPAEFDSKSGDLKLDVYTDKGIIENIDLTKVNTPVASSTGTPTNLITNIALTKIGQGQVVRVDFDNTALDRPSEIDVTDKSQLGMLIHWNAENARALKATLKEDVTITKAMVEELNKSQITKVTIEGSENVILDADVVGALDSKFDFKANVVIAAGEHAVTAKTKAAKITVNKGATLNVNAKNDIAITNKGTLNLNAETASITNNGVATVAADKKAADITNNATLTNNGTIVKLTNNAGATVNNAGTINEGTNAAAIPNEKSAAVINNSGSAVIENKGSIVMATADAKLQATGDGEVDNTILSSTIKAATNTIFVTLKDVTATKVNEVIASSGATKLVLSGTVTNDEVDKDGNPVDVNFKNIKKVVAAANLTFNGKSKVRLSDDETNGAELIVNPGVVVTIESGATVATGKGSGKVTFIPDNKGNKGKLVIKTGAVFYTQDVDENQVENFGELAK